LNLAGALQKSSPNLADAIVEVTETGSSLRANRLRIIDTVMKARRTSSPTAPHTPIPGKSREDR